MESSFDSETNQLLNLFNQFKRISANRGLSPHNPPHGYSADVSTIFERIYDILSRLGAVVKDERLLLEETSTIVSVDHTVRSDVINALELLVRIRANVENERERANEVIKYLLSKDPGGTDDPCRLLLEKLHSLELMYDQLKKQYSSVKCESEVKDEQLLDRENDIMELTQRLLQFTTALENAKNNYQSCEDTLKRQATECAEAKAKYSEVKRCADLAVEQMTCVVHERDQAQKLVSHLQTRLSTCDKENGTLSIHLREIEKQYSDLLMEHDAIRAKIARAAEKEQEAEKNVATIMQECSQRVQTEVDRVKESMQRDMDTSKADNDRLNLELTQQRLKFEQLQRDYRSIEAMSDKLQASIENSSQQEALEKAEAVRRAAAAECARDEALFSKHQLSLKVEKLELALSKLSERCNSEMQSKKARIEELQRHVKELTEENTKCAYDKGELERELIQAKERCIEIDMQYRFKVIGAEEDTRTTRMSCDVKLAAADEAHKKMVNDLARELNSRQSVINGMIEDKKRRCFEMEDKVELLQQQLHEEQSRNRELTRVRADQARRIAQLEDQITQNGRQFASYKKIVETKQ